MERTIILRNINGGEQKINLDEELYNGTIKQLKERINDTCHFSLIWNGQNLCDSKPIHFYNFQNQSLIHIIYSLHGGGNDGGSIPTRGEMVKIKKSSKRNDSTAARRNRWITCSISKQPLVQPIAADELGNIFNKEEVIKGLLEKNLGTRFSHIRSLKDIYEVNFTFNSKYDPTKPVQLGVGADDDESPFLCPVTNQPVNGQLPFSMLITCGHVISEKGLQQLCDSPNPLCFVCQKYFTKSDILPLNPDEETQLKLKSKLLQQRSQEKSQQQQQQPKLKRKLSEDTSKKSSKKPNIPTSNSTQGTVRNTLAVQAALEKVNANHDSKKRLSEAYKSIFSSPSTTSSSTAFFTGTSRGVIK